MAKTMRDEYLKTAIAYVGSSIDALDDQLRLLDASQQGDTKSSAGDKFETSREMMAQRRDVLQAQRNVQVDHRLKLELAQRSAISATVGKGSFVRLSSGQQVVVCTGLGKVTLPDGAKLFVISTDSPLGKALLGKAKGDCVSVGTKEVQILEVE